MNQSTKEHYKYISWVTDEAKRDWGIGSEGIYIYRERERKREREEGI